MNTRNTSVGILGAGISGLSTAYALKKRGIDVTVYEKKNQPGGVIQTHRQNGWLVEKGPNTMLIREQQIWDLIDELGLSNRIIETGEEAKKRFIIRNGKLHPAPMSLVDFLKTDLFSTKAKFRLLKEPFVEAGTDQDESIAHFIRRRLGDEVLDYAVNPFVSGIYAGNPERLSMKHTFTSLHEMEQVHGSLAKGFFNRDKSAGKTKRALISFDKGLQVLPQALADSLGNVLQLNTEIDKISREATGWKVAFTGKSEAAFHKAIISTIPLHTLPNIWADEKSKRSVTQLADVPYAPMSEIGLGFKHEQINHSLDGFGLLIPEKEPYTLLGCLFSSSLFEDRAPENHTLLTCFFGGDRNPELAFGSTKELINKVLPQLSELLTIKGGPVFHHHTYWPKAIPQYTVDYDRYLQMMEQIEREIPGFFLLGNYRGGVSVPDCILNGFEIAKRIETYLS